MEVGSFPFPISYIKILFSLWKTGGHDPTMEQKESQISGVVYKEEHFLSNSFLNWSLSAVRAR